MSTSGGSSAPSGAAGGDLAGTYPNPSVAQINTSPLGTTTGATTNQALAWNGSAWTHGSALTTGTASGDLSGTYPGPTVAQINGSPLGTTTGAATNNVLAWNGSAWAKAAAPSAGAVKLGSLKYTGGTITFQSVASLAELAVQSGGGGTGTLDFAVAAVAGDIIMCWLNVDLGFSGASVIQMDWKATTSGNFISGGLTTGVSAWQLAGGNTNAYNIPFLYTVVSGDISGGNVNFRPFVRNPVAANVTFVATVGTPANFYALNITALATGT